MTLEFNAALKFFNLAKSSSLSEQFDILPRAFRARLDKAGHLGEHAKDSVTDRCRMVMEPDQEPDYAPLSPGERGLLIALLYHLKDQCGLELQDIAAPARSVSINDYCRRAAPKAEPAIFKGVYRTAKANPEALVGWSRSAFESLYGQGAGTKPLDRSAFLTELFPQLIGDPTTLENIAEAYKGIYALYHYRLPKPEFLRNPDVGEGHVFDRLRLEISKADDQSGLRFRLTELAVSFGRTPFYIEETTGFVMPTPHYLYLLGNEEVTQRLTITILPFHLRPPPSFMGMMHKSEGRYYSFKILAIRAPADQENAKNFQPSIETIEGLPLGETNAERLRNVVPLEGRSGLPFPE